jgi:hypothetical protein
MPDLVTTIGGATSNSFVSQDDADDYLDTRLNASAWTDATDDDKARALIEATRELSLMEWEGTRVDDTQALSWPRSYAVNPDASLPLDQFSTLPYFEEDEIPQRILDATCELALEFLRSGTTDLSNADTATNIKRERTGPLETEYFDAGDQVSGWDRFPRILNLIGPLLDSTSSGGLELQRE